MSVMKLCEWCEKEFRVYHAGDRFCSKQHRNMFWNGQRAQDRAHRMGYRLKPAPEIVNKITGDIVEWTKDLDAKREVERLEQAKITKLRQAEEDWMKAQRAKAFEVHKFDPLAEPRPNFIKEDKP